MKHSQLKALFIAAARPTFYLIRVCMFCRKKYGIVETSDPLQHELPTHGTCPECAKIPYEQRVLDYKRGNNVLS